VIEVDEKQWPLVVVTFGGRATLGELESVLATQERWLSAERLHVELVVVRSDLQPWDGSTIRRQATWIKEHEHALRKSNRGVAMVLPSLWLKGVLRAILWLQPLPYPHVVCGTVEEAMAWLDERLRAMGQSAVAAPPGV
jgi:hypothetical protein